MEAHSKEPTGIKESKSVLLFVAAYDSRYTDPTNYDAHVRGRSTDDYISLGRVSVGNGHSIPVVESAKYLGSILSRDGTDKADVEARIASASKVFGALRKIIFCNGDINIDTRVAIYLTSVVNVLLFGCECWTLTSDLTRMLNSFHRRCCRTLFGISMWHVEAYHITTATVLKEIGLQEITHFISKRALAWFGKVYRMPWNRLPRKLLTCWVHEPRRGQPASWGKSILKLMDLAGIDSNNWSQLASDNAAWCDAIGVKFKPELQIDCTSDSDGCGPISIPHDQRILTGKDLVAYTDGSCIGNSHVRKNQLKAGWGGVILHRAKGHIDNPDDLNARIIDQGKIWGPVIIDTTHPSFIGATHGSNNTGELSAIGEVLRWVNERFDNNDSRSVLIRYDSKYAAMVAQKLWSAKSNIQLARTVQLLYTETSKHRTVYFSHVKGHSNHKWNEYADKLANRGRSSNSNGKWQRKERIRRANQQREQWLENHLLQD